MGKRKRSTVEQNGADEAVQGDSFRRRLDADYLAYFHEIRSHFDTLEDLEERTTVADNCLQEVLAKPLQAATDAECSRIIEVLLPCASEEGLLALAAGLLDGTTWYTLATK